MTKKIMGETKLRKDKLKIFNRILVVMILFCGAFYLVTANDFSIKAFVLQQQKKKVFELKNENNDLELNVMALSSFNNLSKKIADLKMVKVDKVDYISGTPMVALKK